MDKLKFISEQMAAINVPYEFGQWRSEIQYPYFVGEQLNPETYPAEDGSELSTVVVTGFHRGSVLALETVKEEIKRRFSPSYGLRGNTDSGAIAVFFNGSFYVPTGESDLKKIQINLTIKEWKGAM